MFPGANRDGGHPELPRQFLLRETTLAEFPENQPEASGVHVAHALCSAGADKDVSTGRAPRIASPPGLAISNVAQELTVVLSVNTPVDIVGDVTAP